MRPEEKREQVEERLPDIKRFLEQYKKQFLIGLGTVTMAGAVTFGGYQYIQAQSVPLYPVLVGDEVIGTVSDPDVVQNWLQKQYAAAREEAGSAALALTQAVTVSEPKWVYKGQSQDAEVLKVLKQKVAVQAKGVQLIIDGRPVAVVTDQESLDRLLGAYRQRYSGELARTPHTDRSARGNSRTVVKEVAFVQSVATREVAVDPDEVMEPQQVARLLAAGTLAERKHTVREGESLWTIASRYDTTVQQLLENNPGLDEHTLLQPGQELVVTAKEPLLSVRMVEETKEIQTVPFATEVVEEPGMLKGEQKVLREGKHGTKQVTYEVTKINGQIQTKRPVKEQIMEAPQNRVIAKGTKVVAERGSGVFRWPTIGGYISSRYGMRDGRLHAGIDIARPSSYSILAADNGRVVFAGWDGGYGNSVIIDHRNGYRTRYAHMSAIDVRVGQVVERGQKIGVMGSTGHSTGTHLHFEVLKNGRTINPLNVL